MARLSERISAARRRAFVGRDAELDRFRRLLAPDADELILFVHGPGGTGKSTLLRQFGFLAEEAGRQTVWLDAREPQVPSTDHAAVLVDNAVAQAARVMEASPRDRRAFRALHHTYLQPAETQVAAAELLGLPMTTYRRHLATGLARITEILWQESGHEVVVERSAD